VAVCLQKRLFYLEDRDGKRRSLDYLRTKEGKEVDFVTVESGRPVLMVEVKASSRSLSAGLRYFHDRYGVPGVQLVGDLRVEREQEGLSVRQALPWLQGLEI
jgi:uncharacterized protein